jgi:hypothetical protein
MEVIKDIHSKYVHVYKIEQNSIKNKKIDIRDVVSTVFHKLYVNHHFNLD